MTALAAVLAATLALPLAHQKPESPQAGGDRAKLQGTWTGESKAQNEETQIEIVIDGDKVILTRTSRNEPIKKVEIKGEYKLDETAKPKAWDFFNGKSSDGRALSDTKAIYELDGDTLKICSVPPGRDRPTELKEQGPPMPQLMIVFTRVKTDAPKPGK